MFYVVKLKKWKWFGAILFCVILVCLGRFVVLPMVFPRQYQGLVEEQAKKYGLPPSLVYGVIHTESSFSPNALSAKGAKGLMQVTDKTGQWGFEEIGLGEFRPEKLYDPSVNIELGCWYLQKLGKQYGWEQRATVLAAYNAGSGNVSKWLANTEYSKDGKNLEKIPFPETKKYVKRVELRQKIYEFLYH